MNISQSDVVNSFICDFGWARIAGLQGHFSVSPDVGTFKRVFSADLKRKRGGSVLLGSIGFISDKSQFGRQVGIGAYITNFSPFRDPPILYDSTDLIPWVGKIADAVVSLPSSPKKLIDSVKSGNLGKFDTWHFLASSPSADIFINVISE